MFTPNRIDKTGDDRPATGLYAFVLRMSGWQQLTVVSLALCVSALVVVPIDLQRRMIDEAIAEKDMDLLIHYALLFLGALLLLGVLKFAMRVYEGWLSESSVLYCRSHLAQLHCQPKDQRGEKEDEGAAVSIIRAEIEQVGGFVGTGFSEPAAQVGTLAAVLGYMLVVEPTIALYCIALLVPQALLAPLLQRKLNALTEERIDALRLLTANIPEHAAAGESSDNAGDLDLFRKRARSVFDNRMRYFLWKFAGKALLNLTNGAAPLAVLLIGGIMVIDGETQLGIVVAFTTGFTRLAEPLRALIAYYRLTAITAVKHKMIAKWMSAGDPEAS